MKTLFQLANIYHLIITLLRKRQFLWTRYFVYILANSDFMVCLCTELNFSKVKWLVFNVKKRKGMRVWYFLTHFVTKQIIDIDTICKIFCFHWNMINIIVLNSFQIETKLKNWSNILFIKYIEYYQTLIHIQTHIHIYSCIYLIIIFPIRKFLRFSNVTQSFICVFN